MSTAYIRNLNDFSRKFIIRGVYVPTKQDAMLYKTRFDDIKSLIFESLLLFDTTCFKVVGENVPLAVLINEFGVGGLEKLIDQNAIRFLHWKTMVGNMVDNIPGVIPLVAGNYNEGPYVDPEESISIGMKSLARQPNKDQRKTIVRKVRDLYESPASTETIDTTSFVTSAFNSGKLKPYGLDHEVLDLYKLPAEKKAELVKCAEELFEYKQLMASGHTSVENSRFFSLFIDTANKINKVKHSEVVSVVADLEGFPDLRKVYNNIHNPLSKVVSLREKKNVIKFRKWLDEIPSLDRKDITRSYLDAIENPQGFFETQTGKLTKIMTMAMMGAGVGALAGPIGASVGAVAGSLTSSMIEPALGVGLDLVDEYFISGITQGWTPRMFFKEVDEIGVKIEPTS
jgi:hypothetical protein